MVKSVLKAVEDKRRLRGEKAWLKREASAKRRGSSKKPGLKDRRSKRTRNQRSLAIKNW